MRYFDTMFIDEVRASLRDWDRKWHRHTQREYMARYDALTPDEQQHALSLLTQAREAMGGLQQLFRRETRG